MGATLAYFPEGANSPQEGRPQASCVQEGVDSSSVRLVAEVDGGEEECELLEEYAAEGSVDEIRGLGDKAIVLAYEDDRAGVLVL